MELITQAVVRVSNALWNGPFSLFLLGIHVYLTAALGVPQRHLSDGIRDTFRSDGRRGGIGPFACLMVNLAASLGVGNIVGVALAVGLGGPGAVFWCWMTGVFGIATKYAESYLAIRHRVRLPDGSFAGGPMYVLAAMKKRVPAVFFAVLVAFGGLAIGAVVPANAMAGVLEGRLGLPSLLAGGLIAFLVGLVIIGGIRSIGSLCEKLVPAMVLLFVGGCLGILWVNRAHVLESVLLILRGTFSLSAGAGGVAGYAFGQAVRHGVTRGIFSNEAGMGTGAIPSAAAQPGSPERQAMVAATSCFWDTVVMCALTGLAFVSAMAADPAAFAGAGGLDIALRAFAQLPVVGTPILTSSLLLLAFMSILGWCYIGERAFEFLAGFGRAVVYRVLWVTAVFVGAIAPLPFVWGLSDICNLFMIFPNLYSIFALRGSVRDSLVRWNRER